MKGLFTKVITKMTPSCQNMTQLCSQSLDRKLSTGERIRMKMHSWICSWCIKYSDQVHYVNTTVKDEGEKLAELRDERLSEDCKARMKALMEASTSKPEKES